MDDQLSIERGCCRKAAGTCSKLEVYDWLDDVVNKSSEDDIIEVRFKNTRKDYYRNVNNLKLKAGDIVAVEASPGHDIGIVTLTGALVKHQMKKHKVTLVNGELRKVYRKAKSVDIDKWREAMSLEHNTMIESRKIAADLKLNMKIGDVEYQGDRTKAIFYYIADERVDFRQLIKVLAETFRIRIEMKQIGARQEAGRIGGIGPCGRELCCATWISNFVSVTTNAARYQEISLNPQKLAGQCGKLKCCLNFEVDAYIDAQKDFPPANVPLDTAEGRFFFQKADIFNRTLYYASNGDSPSAPVAISVERAKEIIRLNKRGKKVEKIADRTAQATNSGKQVKGFKDVIAQESLTRFDEPKPRQRKKKRFSKKKSSNRPRNNDKK
ncbi:stage 0 sporulation family protein [Sunxiuqinia elliptica]|uniref:Cell fate regulator YaaT (PSP1 superfamily) n=1 Tax=Sunxiuqinia elliptica TaxID=655355 RepID=A0A4R6H6C5_9BACT|nr:regulatory iron-sulfur-containing complex subunit RicT [Sunxiuqinia elliptica]TDO03730.1 cell fate regulator YaaT (PSP1 superfamily) [Sunxiuqinia elliptica]TDO62011.1 cell fate regulator YaaT (PSP1 superfamily) [Sunxiuqinia elliptica]